MDGRGAAELAHRMAEAAYADAAKLLAVVDDLGERRRLGRKLKHLRDALDRGSAPCQMRVQTAYPSGDFGADIPRIYRMTEADDWR